MRVLLIVSVVLAAAWSGYWWIGKGAADRDLRALLDAPRTGWTLRYEDLSTSGFPNRFDTTLTAPTLDSGLVRWSAPFLQILRLTYQPMHVIAVLPETQQATLGGTDLMIETEQARASLVFTNETWALGTSVLTAERFALSDAQPFLEAQNARLATRASVRVPGAVDLGIALNEPILGGEALAFASLDAALRLTAPLDRRVLSEGLPSLRQIDIGDARLTWDTAELRITGQLEVTASRSIAGQLELSFRNWREAVDRLRRISFLNPDLADALEDALSDTDSADARLTFELPPQPVSELWGD